MIVIAAWCSKRLKIPFPVVGPASLRVVAWNTRPVPCRSPRAETRVFVSGVNVRQICLRSWPCRLRRRRSSHCAFKSSGLEFAVGLRWMFSEERLVTPLGRDLDFLY
jgi:hypothetical protein